MKHTNVHDKIVPLEFTLLGTHQHPEYATVWRAVRIPLFVAIKLFRLELEIPTAMHSKKLKRMAI